jgi:glycolate oxidase
VLQVDQPFSPLLTERLSQHFGDRLKLLPHERLLYGYDATGISAVPDAVVRISSLEDVQLVVDAARDAGVPIVARGAGSGLSAGSVPEAGGIVLTFEAMRDILSIDVERYRVTVEPGVVNRVLDETLASTGLFYPPDPASHRVSTLGGNIAENSGGPRAVKYGVTGHHVSRLTVVDGWGEAGELTAGELQPSLDLVSLVVGSEGTLALVLGAELKLERRPDYVVTLLLSFGEMAEATAFVSAVIARGIVPATLEFLDRPTVDAIEAWGVAHYPEAAEAILLLDLDGSTERVRSESALVEALAREMCALDVAIADQADEREALWRGRRGSYAAVGRYGKRILTQDVTVPRERLTDMLVEIGRIAETYGLMIATVGHAGDGNLHPDFPYDPDDAEMSRRVHDANMEILRACVARGGSITGEHGIGSDKLHQLPLMYNPVELGLMADVKRALDPAGIFNPGKAVPMEDRRPATGSGRPCPEPTTGEEVQAAILHARASRSPLHIDLHRLTGITPDLGNLTVEVGAGERWEALETVLGETPFSLPVTPLREATIARAVLLNDYGPEHLGFGTLRQSLLAASYVTGAGEIVHMGRGVVKNVAGYDLFRLLLGSRGQLGVPLSFIFRLVPRREHRWAKRPWSPGTKLPRPQALVVLRDDEGLTAYAEFVDSIPKGWNETAPIKERVAELRTALHEENDILDLAMDGRMLTTTVPPRVLAVLPSAARLIARCERGEARRLTQLASRDGTLPVRSLWGRRREPLHRLGPLEARWERSLRVVFDPDAILSDWLTGGETAG